jgi:hypothetical protein
LGLGLFCGRGKEGRRCGEPSRSFMDVGPPARPSVCLSIRPSARPSDRLTVCLSVRPTVIPGGMVSVPPCDWRSAVCFSACPSIPTHVFGGHPEAPKSRSFGRPPRGHAHACVATLRHALHQVERLVSVLSVRGMSKTALVEDSVLGDGAQLTQAEVSTLEAAGWAPGASLRTMLNFTGEPPARRRLGLRRSWHSRSCISRRLGSRHH